LALLPKALAFDSPRLYPADEAKFNSNNENTYEIKIPYDFHDTAVNIWERKNTISSLLITSNMKIFGRINISNPLQVLLRLYDIF